MSAKMPINKRYPVVDLKDKSDVSNSGRKSHQRVRKTVNNNRSPKRVWLQAVKICCKEGNDKSQS